MSSPSEAKKVPEAKNGRATLSISDNYTWEQRIHKENAINGKTRRADFSVRHAVQVRDVPAQFKPGHVDPAAVSRNKKGYDPVALGWDPQSLEAEECLRCINSHAEGPRHRHAYPEAMSHDHGWLVAPAGNVLIRTKHKKMRYGIGWLNKSPAECSESTAHPPLVPPEELLPFKASEALSSLSLTCPSLLSSVGPPALRAPPPSQASGAPPLSRLSAAAPAAPADMRSSSSSVSRASSLPALADTATRLQYREMKLAKAMEECQRYLNRGDMGTRWSKPLGMTDVTKFADDFTKVNSTKARHGCEPFALPLGTPRPNRTDTRRCMGL